MNGMGFGHEKHKCPLSKVCNRSKSLLKAFWSCSLCFTCRVGAIYKLPDTLDFIKVYLDFRNTSCVLTEFGSYAARNMFP